MKKSKPDNAASVEETEAALFYQAVSGVTPLVPDNRIQPHRAPPPARVRVPLSDTGITDVLSDHGSEDAREEYLANGLSRMALRKLRRGTWPVSDSLDLHGSTTEVARVLLQEFLQHATQCQFRCVLLIHGKGMNSRDGSGVLRKLARHWLAQHAQVLAYCSAPPALGGSGAVLVLLKSGA
ncbi:MAG: Smr/MutS family protein [Gallionella sp.]|nr:Smr/MutS family protein [Gallionella sp.]